MAKITLPSGGGVASFLQYTYSANEIPLGFEYEWQKYKGDWFIYSRKEPNQEPNNCPIKLPDYFHVGYESTGWSNCAEIKSCVAPLRIQKILIAKLLRDNDLKNPGNKHSSGSSGIHVHIMRTERIEALASKVFNFFHDYGNKNFFKTISNRSANQFKEWCTMSGTHREWGENRYQYMSHSAIINTERKATFEIRLFGAQPHALLPAVEMADAVFRMSDKVEGINIENFNNFISKDRRYKELKAHIDERFVV